MVKVTCLFRIKNSDKRNAPYVSYMIQDESGLELKINRQALLSAVSNNQAEVSNLRVSADGSRFATIGVVDMRIIPKKYKKSTKSLISKGPVVAYVYNQACVIYSFLGGDNYEDIVITPEKADFSQVRFKIHQAIFYQNKMWFIEGLTCFSGQVMTSTLFLNDAIGSSCDIRMSELMTNDGFSVDMARRMNQVGYKFINDLSKTLKYNIIPLSGEAFGRITQLVEDYRLSKPLGDYVNSREMAGLSS